MKSFKLRFKPFDVFIIIICLVTMTTFIVKGIANKSEVHGFLAFVTLLAGVMYVKAAGICNNP
jgi:hypothetical protein